MLSRRNAIALAALASVAAAAYLWLSPGSSGRDILVRRAPLGSPSATGGGLFSFGNPYLDGRSAWLAGRFREARERLRALASLPPSPTFECRVHREPFTSGPWVGSLDAELAQQRLETESQAVEVEAVSYLEGVEPRHLLLYLASSGFLERIAGEGTLDEEIFLVGPKRIPDGMDGSPRLLESQWLVRERWTRALGQPTATDSIHAAFRDGDTIVLVDEAWDNCGDSSCAKVRLASGQYALLARDGGCLLLLTSFYSGQPIPRFTDPIAASMTVAYYKKVLRTIDEEVRSWTPPPEVGSRFRAMGF